jgi:histone H3/H4
MIEQPQLFETMTENVEIEKVLLYALGDFQSRKKVLADRELALDRLRGAFKRATDKFGIAELSDEQIAETLEKLGAKIVKVQSFVAKHPFRVTISIETAERAKQFYSETLTLEKSA